MSYTSIPWVLIQNFVFDVFCRYGVPEEDAVVCADVLLESDRRGIESHGLNRLKSTYLDRIRDGIQYPVTNFEVLRDSGATAVIDGHDGMGQVIGARSMRLAIDKAKKFGLGMTVVRNSTHYGIAGYFASMATESGCIGITGTNARPTTAPTFGVENMMGTNPMTFGIPTDEPFDFMLDCATSIIQTGKVEVLAREGLPLPEGTVVDRDGAVMKDSREALAALMSGGAALAALGGVGEELGGYKGYGFATVVEILSAALQNGNFLKDISRVDAKGEPRPYHLGHFFIAINVEA
ncbi:MAG: Ldh family oxidoreductase, partial [Synergistaceae bacterium]|nr:Ldh family oxidoreductase [Synergistaceae bacterium]